jgi:hypothetical protein
MSRNGLEAGLVVVRHEGLRDPVARIGTSGGQLANCDWHLRIVLDVTNEYRQAQRLLGGEIE